MTDLNSKDYDLIHAAEILIMYAEAGNLAKVELYAEGIAQLVSEIRDMVAKEFYK